jgi:hypothetical protein
MLRICIGMGDLVRVRTAIQMLQDESLQEACLETFSLLVNAASVGTQRS